MKTIRSDLIQIVVVLAVCFSGLFSFYRLHFSVDFEDEAFYLAMPYAFALGNRPFVDEMATQQTAALFIAPLVKIYLIAFGSTEKIVLSFRYLAFLLMLFVGFRAYRLSRLALPPASSLLICSIAWLFPPFLLPNLSYNLLGSLFLTSSFLWGTSLSLIQNGSKFSDVSKSFLLGIMISASVFAYPPLLIAALFYSLHWTFTVSKVYGRVKKRVFLFYGFWSAVIIAGTGTLGILFYFGFSNVINTFAYVKRLGAVMSIEEKALLQCSQLRLLLENLMIPGIAILTVIFVLRRFKPSINSKLTLGLLAWCAVGITQDSPFYISSGMGILGFYFYSISKFSISNKSVFQLLWIPSFIAGLVTMMSSYNGLPNLSVGFFGASFASIYFLIKLCKPCRQSWKFQILISSLCMIPCLKFAYLQYSLIYGYDAPGPITQLDSRIPSGPFSGIYTRHERVQFLEVFSKDLRTHSYGRSTVLFYDSFPAGYLFTTLRPKTSSVWINNPDDHPSFRRDILIERFNTEDELPDLVVEFDKSNFVFQAMKPRTWLTSDPFRHYFKKMGYQLAVEKPYYLMWTKPLKKQN